MEENNKFTTISACSIGDFRDRGSKFLSFAYPVKDVQEIKEKINLLKKEHPKAVHHCYAYRLGGDGNQFRANDDGEPAGSAGKPILRQIDSLGLSNVLVVVVRYFGGSLLGIPGLINAYKNATLMALESAPKLVKWIEEIYEISFDYPVMGEVLYLLKQCESSIYEQELQLFCIVKAGIPIPYINLYVKKLEELNGVNIKNIKLDLTP